MHTITRLTSVAFAIFMTASFATACGTPDRTVGQARREERQGLSTEQRQEKAAFDRKQQDERSTLTADQAREAITTDMVKQDEQSRHAVDARERLAKIDARVMEMRRIGKKVDAAAVNARDAIQAHIAAFDDEPMAKTDWNIHRDRLNSEFKSLDEHLDRIAKT